MNKIYSLFLFLVIAVILTGCSNDDLTVSYPEYLMIGETHILSISSNIEGDKFIFSSSNNLVASISDKGQIAGLSVGVSLITIKSEISGKTSSQEIEIIARPIIPTIEFIIEEKISYVGILYDYKIKLDDEFLENEAIEFSIYNKNVVIDEENKTIKFLRSGEVRFSLNLKNQKYIRSLVTFNVKHSDEIESYELLFLGNSLTKYTYDIPAMVKTMIEEHDVPVSVDYSNNQYLDQHENKLVDSLSKHEYTHVILQEKSNGLIDDFERFRSSVLKYSEMIRVNGAKTILYETWAYDFDEYNEYLKMQDIITNGYNSVSREAFTDISYVGGAFRIIKTPNPTINLYADINHPSIYGAYLSALVHYNTITGKDVFDVEYRPEQISKEESIELKWAAHIAANNK